MKWAPTIHSAQGKNSPNCLKPAGREQLLGCPGGSVFKNLFTNSRESRNVGSIPGLGRFPGEGNGNPLHSSILACKIPSTEEPGGP